MTKTIQAILLATTLAVSGYAVAQNSSSGAAADGKGEAPGVQRKSATVEPVRPDSATSTRTQGNMNGTTRAGPKSEMTAAERKKMRAERRMANKANRDDKTMPNNAMSGAPQGEKTR